MFDICDICKFQISLYIISQWKAPHHQPSRWNLTQLLDPDHVCCNVVLNCTVSCPTEGRSGFSLWGVVNKNHAGHGEIRKNREQAAVLDMKNGRH